MGEDVDSEDEDGGGMGMWMWISVGMGVEFMSGWLSGGGGGGADVARGCRKNPNSPSRAGRISGKRSSRTR